MPVISMFYGILISMYYLDNKQHKMPHIHAGYQGEESVFNLLSGEVLDRNPSRRANGRLGAGIKR